MTKYIVSATMIEPNFDLCCFLGKMVKDVCDGYSYDKETGMLIEWHFDSEEEQNKHVAFLSFIKGIEVGVNTWETNNEGVEKEAE